MRTAISNYLKAMGQTFFLRDPFFGFGLLLLLAWFDPTLFIYSFSASLIAHLYAAFTPTPKLLRDSGLIEINGFFFGLAMARLFEPTSAFFFAFVLGALSLPLLTKAGFELMQHWKLSPFILPYVLAIWVVCLCARSVPGLVMQPWPELMVPAPQIFWGVPTSMAELLFVAQPLFGLGLLILLLIFSPRRGVFFLLGTMLAAAAIHFVSPEASGWEYAYLSSCSGLVALGLSSSPEKTAWATILLFAGLAAFITLALGELLGEIALPILSLPYVAAFWLALLSRSPRVSLSWSQVRK